MAPETPQIVFRDANVTGQLGLFSEDFVKDL